MVLARSLEEKLERTRERRRAEGQVEMYEQWEAWIRRRMDADDEGEAFNEPPPSKE